MTFTADLKGFANDLKRSTKAMHERGVRLAMGSVKRHTPVDTGWLRSHWQGSNEQSNAVLPTSEKKKGFQSGIAELSKPSAQEVDAALAGAQIDSFQTVYVFNPVEYGAIRNLKGGKRLPAHWFEGAVLVAATALEKETNDVFL